MVLSMDMKITDLKANPKNPRRISSAKKDALRKSIAKFGDLGGFIFNRRSGQLVGGHQRTSILPKDATIEIERTYDEPTAAGTVAEGYIIVEGERHRYREVDVDEQWENAALLAANKHGGEFDPESLSTIMSELSLAGVDMELTGFDPEEIAASIAEVVPTIVPECGEDEVPEHVDPTAKLGDIYQLGRHRLMCGDSTSIDAVETLMAGEKADMVFTDPPYGIDEETDRAFASRTRKAKGNTFSKIIGDDSIDTALAAFSISDSMSETVCYWGGNYYAHKLPPSPAWVVWDKRVEENQRDMNSDCELAYVKHPSKESVRIFRHLWKGMIKGSEHGQGRVHPTQKPIALAEWCFTELDPKGNSVLDLFGGSGSTLIACEKTNRRCFMMELDPRYIDVIVARWEKYTGKKATLLTAPTQT